jgi:hypothetical protein
MSAKYGFKFEDPDCFLNLHFFSTVVLGKSQAFIKEGVFVANLYRYIQL